MCHCPLFKACPASCKCGCHDAFSLFTMPKLPATYTGVAPVIHLSTYKRALKFGVSKKEAIRMATQTGPNMNIPIEYITPIEMKKEKA